MNRRAITNSNTYMNTLRSSVELENHVETHIQSYQLTDIIPMYLRALFELPHIPNRQNHYPNSTANPGKLKESLCEPLKKRITCSEPAWAEKKWNPNVVLATGKTL